MSCRGRCTSMNIERISAMPPVANDAQKWLEDGQFRRLSGQLAAGPQQSLPGCLRS
jgi:hypothetical protein